MLALVSIVEHYYKAVQVKKKVVLLIVHFD